MKTPSSLIPLLLSFLLVLDQSQLARALNFGALDTPLLDAVSIFLCSEERQGPVCSVLGILANEESEQAAETGEGQATLGQFLFSVTCNTGVMPNMICRAFGADTPESDEDAGNEAAAPAAASFNGEGSDRIITDGVLLGLLCGDDGYGPDAVCAALVGADQNSGLMRTFCESGVVRANRLCGLVGIETPQEDNGGGRRMLRH